VGLYHRIAVLVDELTCIFEPDEEGCYRVPVNPEQPVKTNTIAIPIFKKMLMRMLISSHKIKEYVNVLQINIYDL
jgi:hypothetical protein